MIELDLPYMGTVPRDSDSLRQKIHKAIRLNGGLTDNELYGMFPNRLQGTVRARRVELVRDGKVYSGPQVDGRTVWVAL